MHTMHGIIINHDSYSSKNCLDCILLKCKLVQCMTIHLFGHDGLWFRKEHISVPGLTMPLWSVENIRVASADSNLLDLAEDP